MLAFIVSLAFTMTRPSSGLGFCAPSNTNFVHVEIYELSYEPANRLAQKKSKK